MSEQEEQLGALLGAFRKRISLLVTERMVCWGVAIAGVVAMLLVIINYFTEWYVTPVELGLVTLLGALGGIIYMRRHPISDLAVALTVERRLNLKQRVSTAITMEHDEGIGEEFRTLISADAVAHAPTDPPHVVFPRKFSRHHKVVLASWAVVIVLFFLPNIPWIYSPADREERASVQEAGKTIQQMVHELKKDHPDLEKQKVANQILRNMKKLGVSLERNRIPKKTALVRMNQLEEQLAKLEKNMDRQEQTKSQQDLQKSLDDLQQAMKARSPQEQQDLENAKKKLANGMSPNKLTEQEKKALDSERQLNKLTKQMKNGDLEGAANTLNDLGQNLQSLNLTPEQLKQLKNALKNGIKVKVGKGLGKSMGKAGDKLADARKALAGLSKTASSGQCPNCGGKMVNGKCQNCGACMGDGQCGSNGNGNGQGNQPGNGQGNGKPNQGGNGFGGALQSNNHPRPYDRNGNVLNPTTEDAAKKDKDQSYSIDIKGEPGKTSQTNVPYYEVYPDYRTRAEHAVDAENVPPSERQRVKQYFTALDPNGN